MLFDQPPAELPRATLRPREGTARWVAFAGTVKDWIAARWSWFRPRTLPMFAAFLGMLAVLASANYLRNFARQSPERLTVRIVSEPPAVTVIEQAPRVEHVNAIVKRAHDGAIHAIDLSPTTAFRLELAPRDPRCAN